MLKNRKKIALLFFLVTAGLFLFSANSANAQTNITLELDYPPIPAPTIEGGVLDLNCIEGEDSPRCDGEAFPLTTGVVLLFLFVLTIWVSGILAMVYLIYAGVLYILSGAKPAMRSKAKTIFANVIYGIAIIFFAVIMFNLINPDISKLNITGQEPIRGREPQTGNVD